MIGEVNPTQQYGVAAGLYQSLGVGSVTGASTSILASTTPGAGDVGQSNASISGPGQLLSDLEQLQTQNPDEFKQLVTQIASQLQAAAKQQGQTPAGQVLTNLADEFQKVADGGSLSQLQLQPHHHQRYQSNGQTVPGNADGSTSSSPDTTIQQLFATIAKEVSQALAAK